MDVTPLSQNPPFSMNLKKWRGLSEADRRSFNDKYKDSKKNRHDNITVTMLPDLVAAASKMG